MLWMMSHRFDRTILALADRHYNRQKPGTPQFVPPGRCLVLRTENKDAFWVTSWPEFAQHAWVGAWICTAFRNESEYLSSILVSQAVAATRWKFGEPPALGMVTFVNTAKVRKKRDFGRCYRKAGFHQVGYTQSGLVALQILPEEMPLSDAPLEAQQSLW